MIKYIIKRFIWIILHFFFIFPINKKRFFFTSFHGAQYSCNPKYIYLYLRKVFQNKYEYVWEFKDKGKAIYVPDSKVVKTNSFSYIYFLLTSKYIFDNTEFPWFIPLRKSQVLVETWHGGGAYKKVGLAANWNKLMFKEQVLNSKQISYYISSSRKFTEVQSVSKNVPSEKFIKIGMPRNEMLLLNSLEIKHKVYDSFNLDIDVKLVLFAPTYRGKPGFKSDLIQQKSEFESLDYERLVDALEKKFGGRYKVLFRGHYYDSKCTVDLPDIVLDATKYEDMQELLSVSDVLITDYSSSMWDFGLSRKKGFLFMPDLEDYKKNRGEFYTDPDEWPFYYALNNDELVNIINNFENDAYQEKVKNHYIQFESFEAGDSCKKLFDVLGIR